LLQVTTLKSLLKECGIGLSKADSEETPAAGAGHRVLLFCQMKVMMDVIETDLFQKHMPNVSYLRMDGSVPATKRQGPLIVLMVTLQSTSYYLAHMWVD